MAPEDLTALNNIRQVNSSGQIIIFKRFRLKWSVMANLGQNGANSDELIEKN